VPCRDVVYRWRRNEEGRLVYRLWSIKPIMGLDPNECDHDDAAEWWEDYGVDPC
jgi:hypothetical protein